MSPDLLKFKVLGFVALNCELKRPVGGGPAGVDEGMKDRSGGGPAGVVEGMSRLERRESGVEGGEEDGTRNIAALRSADFWIVGRRDTGAIANHML